MRCGKLPGFVVICLFHIFILSKAQSGIAWMHGGHTRDVVELKLAADNPWLASACGDGSVKIWSVDDGQLRKSLFGNTNSILAMDLSRDGTKVAAAVDTGEVITWEIATGKVVRRWMPHLSTTALRFSRDGMLLASGSGEETNPTVKVWSFYEGELLRTFVGHTAAVTTVQFTTDGKEVISTSLDHSIRHWSLETGELQQKLQPVGSGYTGALIDDGNTVRLFFATGPTRLNRYIIPSWSVVAPFPYAIDSRNVRKLAASSHGHYLAGGSTDGTASVWPSSIEPIEFIYNVNSSGGLGVQAICFGPETPEIQARTLLTGGSDWAVKEWSLFGGEFLRQFGYLRAEASAVEWSPNGDWLALGGGTSLNLFESNGKYLRSFQQTNVNAAVFSPQGSLLVTADSDAKVRLWRAADGLYIRTLGFHMGAVNALAYAPNGLQFATASEDRSIRTWNTNAASPLLTLLGSPVSVERITYSKDSGTIISGDRSGTLKWWRAGDGQATNTVQAHANMISELRVSPDGALLASCSMYETDLKLWRLSGATHVRSISAEYPIVSCAFSPDGNMIAGSIRDPANHGLTGEVRIWRVDDGSIVRSFTRETERAGRVSWSKNNLLAVGRMDGVAVILDPDRTIAPPLLRASQEPRSARVQVRATAEIGTTLRLEKTRDFAQWNLWTNSLATGKEQVFEYTPPGMGEEFFRALVE